MWQKRREEGGGVGRRWGVNCSKSRRWLCLLLSQWQLGCSAGTWQGALLLGGKWEREASLGRHRAWRARRGSQRGCGGSRQMLGVFVRGGCCVLRRLGAPWQTWHGKGQHREIQHPSWELQGWYLPHFVWKLGCRIWLLKSRFPGTWGRVRVKSAAEWGYSWELLLAAVVFVNKGRAVLWCTGWETAQGLPWGLARASGPSDFLAALAWEASRNAKTTSCPVSGRLHLFADGFLSQSNKHRHKCSCRQSGFGLTMTLSQL